MEEVIKWADEMGLQMNIAKMSKQAKKLLDEFKVDKYKTMNLGKNNLNHVYVMLNLERGLGVTVEGSVQLTFHIQQQQLTSPTKYWSALEG